MISQPIVQTLFTSLTAKQLKELILETLTEFTQASLEKKSVKNNPDEEKYLTRNEVASFLQISLPTLHEYAKKEIIPSYRIGSKIRFKASEVVKALEQRVFSFRRKGGNPGA